jgi:uncharacterized protein
VALDDVDPYRDRYGSPVAPRLSESELARWQRGFQQAWREIDGVHHAYALGLGTGLTTLTPLIATGDDRDSDAAAQGAFGAIAAELPDDPDILAFVLIREFQRVKLGGMLDLYDLCHRTGDPAQQEEARQLERLLADAYTQLAVTDFWRVRQKVSPGGEVEAAGQRYAYSRAHTRQDIQTLANSALLTPLGWRFVSEMRHSADK